MKPALTAVALALLAPGGVLACEPSPRPGTYEAVDRPIAVQPDGSFFGASRDDDWAALGGNPVVDIGGGRVGQVIGQDLGDCTIGQTLLVADCTRGEAIAVEGLPRALEQDELWTGGVSRSARLLQPPHGPLALTPDVTVAAIATLAAREGWAVRTDVAAYAAERGPQNAFDPFQSCEIFYPGSVGAAR